MTSKARHDDGGSGNPRFHLKFIETMRFMKKREFKKDIQIQIRKPKYHETHMKSKTRHIDDRVIPRVFMRKVYGLL